MSPRVGIELTPDTVRAVVVGGWRLQVRATFETAWDPTRPHAAVALLRGQIGAVGNLGLAIGLGFLHVKHVSLPPAPLAERRRMLALEPDRFFPVQDETLAVALSGDDDLAFAVDSARLTSWVEAFERWAPVDHVVPAPVALVDALARAGASDGTYALPAAAGEIGLVELREGRLRAARRATATGEVAAREAAGTSALPSRFVTAYGAAMTSDAPVDALLLPESVAARVVGRRRRRATVAGIVCAAALVFAAWSVDHARSAHLDRLERELASLEPAAAPALALQNQLAALDREAAVVDRATRERRDPLQMLAALTERLPPDVTVLSVRANGDTWQLDGRATNAAAIIPALDKDPHFESVRFLAATTRFRERNRTYESFSIALRARPRS
jgi:Tfp pilus assembly protein PilN